MTSAWGKSWGRSWGSSWGIIAVGDIPRRYIRREELDRRFKEQRDNTFSRRWFDELIAARQAAAEEAKESTRKAERKALEQAAKAAAEVAEEIRERGATPDISALVTAVEMAASASKLKEIIEQSNRAMKLAKIVKEAMAAQAEIDDEEDAVMALLAA